MSTLHQATAEPGNRRTDARVVRRLLRIGSEGIVFFSSIIISFILRFNLVLPRHDMRMMYTGALLAVLVKLSSFRITGAHRDIWRFVGLEDLKRLLYSNVLGTAIFTVLSVLWFHSSFPRSVYIIDLFVSILFTAGLRVAVRTYSESSASSVRSPEAMKSIIIYGAGAAGRAILHEIRQNPHLNCRVIGFVDDDPLKAGATLSGIPILGSGADLSGLIAKLHGGRRRSIARTAGDHGNKMESGVDEVLIAMPTATGEQMGAVLRHVQAAGLHCRTVPCLAENIHGQPLLRQIREVRIEDLLGRKVVTLPGTAVSAFVQNKVILVTGGGGSIGSELCRQLVALKPKQVIILERSELALYQIERELAKTCPPGLVLPVLGDVLDERKLLDLFTRFNVTTVFHAAAYKHVPIMELQPGEAVRNNIFGTHCVARCAAASGVKEFVMISSDKAVRPTNVMGATKRAAELVVGSMGNRSECKFVSVRFGNVLGSSGSVIPLFREQLSAGGPITVTHPDMQRYFMTIPEAVQLVLQAAAMCNGGETFVLDMGSPVKIVELAENLIRLSGLRPYIDINIVFTGTRPGEKLYEELIAEGETVLATHHPKIKILGGASPTLDHIQENLARLREHVEMNDEDALIGDLRCLVPEYRPASWSKNGAGRAVAQSTGGG